MIRRPNIKLDRFQMFMLSIGCLISIYSFYFFMSNKVYLIGSDVYYYMSIADSIIENGEMKDITTIPSRPVKTPQNGIAFVHVILSLLGIGAREKILTIVVANYLLFLSGVYPLYRIARRSGLEKGLSLAALLSVYLGAWHIYRINLLAINDGIFNSMILWLIYLIVEFVQYTSAPHNRLNFKRNDLKRISVIFLFVIFLIHFRLNVILVIGSALISSLMVKNFRASAWFIVSCTLLVISFFSVYLFVEVARLDNVTERYLYPMFTSINLYSLKLQLWKILPRLVAGLSGLTNPLATLIFTIFPLSMMYCGFRGIIEKNFSKVFIASICLTGLWFTMSFQNPRTIWYIFPFIYLILLENKKSRIFGYIFVLLVFVQSLQQFYIGYWRDPESNLHLFIYNNEILLEPNSILITYRGRHGYILLNTSSYRSKDFNRDGTVEISDNLSWEKIKGRRKLFVLGDKKYIKSVFSQINEVCLLKGYKLESNAITPDLDEFKGWALVELKLKKINKTDS